MSLIKQNTTKKKQEDKNIIELYFKIDDNKKYKVELT